MDASSSRVGREFAVGDADLAQQLSTHLLIGPNMIWRRHFPIWTTSGIICPAGDGTSFITKCPVASVNAAATGWPETGDAQVSQVAPEEMSASG